MSAAIQLLKRGMHEMPILVYGTAFLALTGVGYIFVHRRHQKYEIYRKTWKRRYTVVREEDYDPKKQVYKPDQRFPLF